ncbi:MAG: 16S rRNA (guanine(966)-N(2))-methyltransferase RsmD [Deltaproteobacteria bacterium]|nr:MAG: 16S rRNA (guanine(966)-N(2))-methyltransferase RsmD [Deltaproteobacteria bacterium]
MRVVGGEFKGRKLFVPRGGRIRPTSDRVREAIFDILGPDWIYHKVLDLFAGTGALGIEALSRGATEAVFVEQGREALKILRGNLESLGLTAKALVLPLAAKRGIKVLAKRGDVFDLVFMDPPYGKDLVGQTIQEIVQRGILSPHGIIVAEHAPTEVIPSDPSLELSLQRRYGETAISFFRGVSLSP